MRDHVGLKKGSLISVSLACTLIASSCALKDSERCDEGQIFNGIMCYPPASTDDTDSEIGDAGDDTDADGGDDLPTCIDDPCYDPEAGCPGCEADYCAYDPIAEVGGCTVQNCATSPDSCPAGYTCCEFIEALSFPNFCMPDTDWEEQHANGICVD
jgi:hypothetical protein